MRVSIVLASSLLYLCNVSAQTTFPTEYPADAIPVSGSDIPDRFVGKVFTVKSTTSGSWRLQFDKFGYVFVDTDKGFRDSGPWRVEGQKWCATLQKIGESCEELYAVGEVLYYKRSKNGEVVSMTLR